MITELLDKHCNGINEEIQGFAETVGVEREENIIVSRLGFYDEWNTGMMYDRFIINTDVLPAEQTEIGRLTANSRVTGKATIAHENVGHYKSLQGRKGF